MLAVLITINVVGGSVAAIAMVEQDPSAPGDAVEVATAGSDDPVTIRLQRRKARAVAAKARERAQERAKAARRRARLVKRLNRELIWPVDDRVSGHYGWRVSPITGQRELHGGTDLACARGKTVRAAGPGTVLLAGRMPVYGNAIAIEHDGGWTTFYAHLKTLAVHGGQTVDAHQAIGRCGSTGWSTGPHLHFELRTPAGRRVDAARKVWRPRGEARRVLRRLRS